MKKLLVIGAVLVVVLLAVGAAGLAYAQTQTPYFHNGSGMMGGRSASGQPGNGAGMMGGRMAATPGSGMMGGRGGRGGWGMMGSSSYGAMHQIMVDALAKELGMTSADLQTALQNGKTPYQLAHEKGLTAAQISSLMQKVHDEALKQAVASGALTQQQADWMDQHMEQMWSNGFGSGVGGCPGFNGQTSSNPTN
jgi:hypothetical protein